MAKKKTKRTTKKKVAARKKVSRVSRNARKKKSMVLPIVALILNVVFLPGLGSLVGGRVRTGIWQIVLFIVGALLTGGLTVIIGVPVILAAWIWGIVTGVNLIEEAR